jgi:hypothetical protein
MTDPQAAVNIVAMICVTVLILTWLLRGKS